MLLYVEIVVVAVVITELAWLKKKKEDVLLRPAHPSVSTCRCAAPENVCSTANSLVADKITRDVRVWLITAYDCKQS